MANLLKIGVLATCHQVPKVGLLELSAPVLMHRATPAGSIEQVYISSLQAAEACVSQALCCTVCATATASVHPDSAAQ